MKYYILPLCLCLLSCGIEGVPLSPSEQKQNQQKSILPFEDAQETSSTEKKNYISYNELGQIGQDYHADFGIESDRLDDVFERIKPITALPKRRTIIPVH